MYWDKINKSMKKAGVKSWYALSKLSEVSESTITSTRIRNGYLSFENTCKIANALRISLDELNEWKN